MILKKLNFLSTALHVFFEQLSQRSLVAACASVTARYQLSLQKFRIMATGCDDKHKNRHNHTHKKKKDIRKNSNFEVAKWTRERTYDIRKPLQRYNV